MKAANKSTEILQIKIYLLLLQRIYQIKYLYMSKEKQETGYVYILTNPSFRERGHGDRYIGSLFRVDEPVPDDSNPPIIIIKK